VRKEDRYPTAAALQADIEEFLQEMGSRVSAREVGAHTAKTFSDARAHVKVLIEDQLRLVREHPDPQSIVPMVTLIQGTGSMTSPGSQSYPNFAPPAPRRKVAIALAAGGLTLMLAIFLLVWSPSPSAEATRESAHPVAANPSPQAPPAPAEPLAPPPMPPSIHHVKLTVETTPKYAKVSIDDAFLPANTQAMEISKDNALHRVRAEAPGFRPKTEWVRFDSEDIVVKIALEPNGTPLRKGRKDGPRDMTAQSVPVNEPYVAPYVAPSIAPPAPAPAANPTPAPQVREIEAAPARRQSPAQHLDTGDPWKK